MVLGTVVITSSKYRHENHPSRLQIKTTRNMRNISPPNLLLPLERRTSHQCFRLLWQGWL